MFLAGTFCHCLSWHKQKPFFFTNPAAFQTDLSHTYSKDSIKTFSHSKRTVNSLVRRRRIRNAQRNTVFAYIQEAKQCIQKTISCIAFTSHRQSFGCFLFVCLFKRSLFSFYFFGRFCFWFFFLHWIKNLKFEKWWIKIWIHFWNSLNRFGRSIKKIKSLLAIKNHRRPWAFNISTVKLTLLSVVACVRSQ